MAWGKRLGQKAWWARGFCLARGTGELSIDSIKEAPDTYLTQQNEL
jgi:hypothetical protein